MKQTNRRYLSLTLATLGGRRVSLDLERFGTLNGRRFVTMREITEAMKTLAASDVTQTIRYGELLDMDPSDFRVLCTEIAEGLAAREARNG